MLEKMLCNDIALTDRLSFSETARTGFSYLNDKERSFLSKLSLSIWIAGPNDDGF
jgi:hypothetical protein